METVNLHDFLRPVTFDDVVGQDGVVRDMSKAIEKKRIPSTVLITGPFGTGKTTLAFLLARYLNCETGDACGECPSCKAMSDDPKDHPDVTFIDIGSNGKIDDIRNLQKYVNLSPRFKKRVFVLDEAHALGSQAAATALLTTLESPPKNTVFVLCTTDPDKLLPTVKSRGIHFKLNLLEPEDVIDGLMTAAKKLKLRPKTKEGKQQAAKCFKKIAEASGGHMRDALSIMQLYIPNLDTPEDWNVEELDTTLPQTEDVKTALDLVVAMLEMDLEAVIRVLRAQKEMRPILHSLRWLLFYVIGDAVKSNKFQTNDLKAFLAIKRDKKLKYNIPMLVKAQHALITIESFMNQGVNEQVVMETELCRLLVNEYEGK